MEQRRHRLFSLGSLAGFTLLEVLVALFVLAVGVAGAAATQARTMRLRQQAALESEAVQLASSLAARMRANPVQMALPDAGNPYIGLDYDAAGGEPPRAPVQCFGATGCDAAQMALFDWQETARAVRAAFPGGRIVVCRDSRAWDAARGALDWGCAGGAGAPVVAKLGWRSRGAAGDGTLEATPFVAMVVAR